MKYACGGSHISFDGCNRKIMLETLYYLYYCPLFIIFIKVESDVKVDLNIE
jgi:hypothetical protein